MAHYAPWHTRPGRTRPVGTLRAPPIQTALFWPAIRQVREFEVTIHEGIWVIAAVSRNLNFVMQDKAT